VPLDAGQIGDGADRRLSRADRATKVPRTLLIGVEFPDGRYVVGDAPARFVFNTSIS
jgi:hypothetical protein